MAEDNLNYVVLTAKDTYDLMQKVNEMIQQGYVPLGGISFADGYQFQQAVVRQRYTIQQPKDSYYGINTTR